MVLRGATSLRGALEGVGPENLNLLWVLKKYSSCVKIPLIFKYNVTQVKEEVKQETKEGKKKGRKEERKGGD